MGDLHGGFPQQEALIRSVQVHPGLHRAGRFGAHDLVHAALDDPTEVVAWVKGVDGELEPGSALDPTMAVAGVASPLGEDGSDVPGEAEGSLRRSPGNTDGGPDRQLAQANLEVGLAFRQGRDPARRVHLGDSARSQDKLALRGDVPFQAVGFPSQDQ